LVLTLLLVAPSPVSAGGFDLQEVAEGIYVHQGVHVGFDDDRRDDIANIGFIVGEKCVAVVDTGGSVRIGKSLRDALRSITDRGICFVINTHEHYDHLLGNAAFLEDSPEFVGHADLPDAVEASRQFFVEEFPAALGGQARSDSVIGPGRAVAGDIRLDLGGRTLELTAHRTAHSHTDLSVYDAKTGTIWLGDLIFIDRIPALDGSLRGWIELLSELQSHRAARAVPGHGPRQAAWPEAAASTLEYLQNLRAEVGDCIARGLFLEEAVETAGQTEKLRWLLHEQHHRRNVSKAYVEMEWE
ncbi:MAG: quinoprotein relay system zinc metallohydrolase 2, partial [Gammaproteobacteria bacterium]|nr:quinoprotein relay system zinc metallohydrolase 2 [Gammaproteobacteria bacterium]